MVDTRRTPVAHVYTPPCRRRANAVWPSDQEGRYQLMRVETDRGGSAPAPQPKFIDPVHRQNFEGTAKQQLKRSSRTTVLVESLGACLPEAHL